jgi:hypothetical protein
LADSLSLQHGLKLDLKQILATNPVVFCKMRDAVVVIETQRDKVLADLKHKTSFVLLIYVEEGSSPSAFQAFEIPLW